METSAEQHGCMQANDREVPGTFPITDAASGAFVAQVWQSEAMRRCARRIRDDIARGRLAAELVLAMGECAVRIDALGAMLDNPEALIPDDARTYARVARDLTRALAHTTVDHELADRFATLSERRRVLLRFRNRQGAVPPSFAECGRQIGIGDEGTRLLYYRTCRWLASDSA